MRTPSLETIFVPQHLYQALNIQPLNTILPAFSCRICNHGKLCGHRLPDSGWWWSCNYCKFTGSTLKLYMAIINEPDLRTAVLRLVSSLPTVKLPPVTFAQLDQWHEWNSKLAGISTTWFDLVKYLYATYPHEAILRLREWDPDPVVNLDHVRGEIGAFNRGILGACTIPTRGFEKGYNNSAMLRADLAPGFPASFYVTNKTRTNVIYLNDVDCGLFGLQDVSQDAETVYAVGDPTLWIMLKKRLRQQGVEMPLLGYVHEPATAETHWKCVTTQLAWGNLHQPKVVFWNPDFISSLIAARRLGNRGWVSDAPRCLNEEDPYYILTTNLLNFHATLDKHAVPWQKGLADLIDLQSPIDVADLLETFGAPLDLQELQTIKLYCQNNAWEKLQQAMSGIPSGRVISYRSRTFIERPSHGLFRLNPQGSAQLETKVSDAYLELQAIEVVKRKTWYTGLIKVRSTELPFRVNEKELLKPDFIIRQCLQAGLAAPYIDVIYQKHLVNIAKLAGTTQSQSAVRIGWHEDTKTMRFPTFSIRAHEVVPSDINSHFSIGVPGTGLTGTTDIPKKSQLTAWSIAAPATEIAWCVLAGLLHNLLAPVFNFKKRGMFTLDDELGAGLDVVTRLGEELKLVRIAVTNEGTPEEISRALVLEAAHDLPVVLPAACIQSSTWVRRTQQQPIRNCIFSVSQYEADKLAFNAPWLGIYAADGFRNPADWLAGLSGVIPLVLTSLLKNADWLSGTTDPAICILRALKARLYDDRSEGSPAVDALFDRAESRFIPQYAADAATRRLSGIFSLVAESLKDGATTITNPVTVNKETQQVFISAEVLHTGFKAQAWPCPGLKKDFLALWTKHPDLTKTKEGWTMSFEAWKTKFKQWQESIPQEP